MREFIPHIGSFPKAIPIIFRSLPVSEILRLEARYLAPGFLRHRQTAGSLLLAVRRLRFTAYTGLATLEVNYGRLQKMAAAARLLFLRCVFNIAPFSANNSV